VFGQKKKDITLNARIARRTTLIFGTMWMFYVFFIYGLLPLIPALSQYQATLMYWSTWVQLWALPLIMVGQQVISRETEVRDRETHDATMAELQSAKDEVRMLKAILKEQHAYTEIALASAKEETALLRNILQQVHDHLGLGEGAGT
jgi:hypothetical protein